MQFSLSESQCFIAQCKDIYSGTGHCEQYLMMLL